MTLGKLELNLGGSMFEGLLQIARNILKIEPPQNSSILPQVTVPRHNQLSDMHVLRSTLVDIQSNQV